MKALPIIPLINKTAAHIKEKDRITGALYRIFIEFLSPDV
jgi:hypothetical protein